MNIRVVKEIVKESKVRLILVKCNYINASVTFYIAGRKSNRHRFKKVMEDRRILGTQHIYKESLFGIRSTLKMWKVWLTKK